MELRELKYFLAVAEYGNITKAAEELYITQPNLSRQIQNLESELGQRLFVRGKRKATLTSAGVLLQKRAEEIVSLINKTKEELTFFDKSVVGSVEIGGGESYVIKLIAQVVKGIQKDYPEVKFNSFSGDTNDVMAKLDEGLLDFGILIAPVDVSKYDYLRLPLVDTWGILARKNSPLSTRSTVSPSDLIDKPLIFSKHAYGKNPVTGWFGKDYEKLNVVATYNLIYNASLMVQEGMGYAVGLDKLINTSGDSELRFIPFAPALTSELYIAWKKYTVFSNAAEFFLRKLKTYVQSLE